MKPDLDRIDGQILAALQKNGRLSNKELAAQVGLAPSSCLERFRRLKALNLIRGIHAEVDPAALGIGLQAFISIRLRRHRRTAVQSFKEHAFTLPEVVAVYNVTGEVDFLVHVVVRDAQHLFELARDAFTTRGEVDHLQTSLIFEAMRRPEWPDLREPAERPASGRQRARRSAR
jgi:DNA-binding Lrp family transcriptional regulator